MKDFVLRGRVRVATSCVRTLPPTANLIAPATYPATVPTPDASQRSPPGLLDVPGGRQPRQYRVAAQRSAVRLPPRHAPPRPARLREDAAVRGRCP